MSSEPTSTPEGRPPPTRQRGGLSVGAVAGVAAAWCVLFVGLLYTAVGIVGWYHRHHQPYVDRELDGLLVGFGQAALLSLGGMVALTVAAYFVLPGRRRELFAGSALGVPLTACIFVGLPTLAWIHWG